MWLVIRLSVLVGAFLLRLVGRASPRAKEREIGGRAAYAKVRRAHIRGSSESQVTGFQLGVAMPGRILLRIEHEDGIDRFFKSLGLCSEVQTGDAAFDRLIFVACDHDGLHDLLVRSADARAAIRIVFEHGFSRIRHDGTSLWIEKSALTPPDESDWEVLAQLSESMEGLERELREQSFGRRMRFAWRGAACEATTVAVFAFGSVNILPMLLSLEASLAMGTLVLYGMIVALAGFVLLQGIVLALLRGSSRLRFVLIESLVVSAVFLPVIGVQAVADVNERLGTVERWSGTRAIEGRDLRDAWGKKRRRRYYAILAPGQPIGGCQPPIHFRIDFSTYQMAVPGSFLEIAVARGSLGLPWMAGYRVQWTPPRVASLRPCSQSHSPSQAPIRRAAPAFRRI